MPWRRSYGARKIFFLGFLIFFVYLGFRPFQRTLKGFRNIWWNVIDGSWKSLKTLQNCNHLSDIFFRIFLHFCFTCICKEKYGSIHEATQAIHSLLVWNAILASCTAASILFMKTLDNEFKSQYKLFEQFFCSTIFDNFYAQPILDTFISFVKKEIRRYFVCRLININFDEVAQRVNHYNQSRQIAIQAVNLSA